MTSTIADLDLDQAAAEVTHTYHQSSPSLGASKLNTYLRCPRAYQYQYVERVPVRKNAAAVAGSTIHKVVEEAHRRRWTVENTADAERALLALWDRTRESCADPGNPDSNGLIIEAGRMLIPWYLHWIEDQLPVATEEHWQIDLPGTDLVLEGTIDRVYRQAGRTVVSDIKSGRRTSEGDDLRTDLQLTIYSWAYRQMTDGEVEDAMEIVALRKRQSVRTRRTQQYIDATMEQTILPAAAAIRAAAESGVFPCNTSSKYGCGYCDYQSLCAIGQGDDPMCPSGR